MGPPKKMRRSFLLLGALLCAAFLVSIDSKGDLYAIDGCQMAGSPGSYFVSRSAMLLNNQAVTQSPPSSTSPHTLKLGNCTSSLSAASAQPFTITMQRPSTPGSSDDTANTFQILRKSSVREVSFTLRVTDKVGKVLVPSQFISLGASVTGGRRLLTKQTTKKTSRKKRGRHTPSKMQNNVDAEVPQQWPKRRLLKGSWGGGSSSRRRYSSWRRRYSSRRRTFYYRSGYIARRRRAYATYYSSGQPAYYNGLVYRNSYGYGASYGIVQQRLNSEYEPSHGAPSYAIRDYGFTGRAKGFGQGTVLSNVKTMAYTTSECALSCSAATSCAGKDACRCVSCSRSGSWTLPEAFSRDILMKTGWVPNNAQWPVSITISNLKYSKTQSTSSVSADLSTDLMITYDEVDTPSQETGGAYSTAVPSLIGLAVTMGLTRFFL